MLLLKLEMKYGLLQNWNSLSINECLTHVKSQTSVASKGETRGDLPSKDVLPD